MKRVRIGDVVEFKTGSGLAYALYTHQHLQFGGLLRISSELFEVRPENLKEVFFKPILFSCFFPLGAAVGRSIVSIVGNIEVPSTLSDFPIFRDGIADPATGKVRVWWLWDGENEWKVGSITDAQRKFPIRAVLNDTMLIDRIEQRWTPETDSE